MEKVVVSYFAGIFSGFLLFKVITSEYSTSMRSDETKLASSMRSDEQIISDYLKKTAEDELRNSLIIYSIKNRKGEAVSREESYIDPHTRILYVNDKEIPLPNPITVKRRGDRIIYEIGDYDVTFVNDDAALKIMNKLSGIDHINGDVFFS